MDGTPVAPATTKATPASNKLSKDLEEAEKT